MRYWDAPFAVVVVLASTITFGHGFGYLQVPTFELSYDAPNLADWMQGWGSVVNAAVSVVLLWGLVLAYMQLRTAHQWNRMNATFTYFQTAQYLQFEKCATEALKKITIDLPKAKLPLTVPELEKIWGDHDSFTCTRDFLNFLEDFAAAVNAGALDEKTAYTMMSGLVVRYGTVFDPFVKRRQVELGDSEAHMELARLAQKWGVQFRAEGRNRPTAA